MATLIASYPESNQDDYTGALSTPGLEGVSFTNTDEINLYSAKIYIRKANSGSGTVVARLYSHTGTYGSSGVPGTLLATSDAIAVSGISSSFALVEFFFTGAERYLMAASTHYFICLDKSAGDESVQIGLDASSSTWEGNSVYAGSYYPYDLLFYVYGQVVTAILVLTTEAETDLAETSATSNGTITDIGSGDADERGFVFGTTSEGDPGDVAPGSSAYDDFVNETGTYGAISFDLPLTGLVASTTYYCRAYAHNGDGYAYGNEITFDTTAAPPWRFENIGGVTYDPVETKTIFAERLNELLDRLHDLDGLDPT